MIKIITGDTAAFTFTIIYPGAVDGVENPDLSETDVKFAISTQKRGKEVILVEKTIHNPQSNVVYFELTPEETSVLTPGKYDACCKVYFDFDAAVTVWLDNVIVIKGVLNA